MAEIRLSVSPETLRQASMEMMEILRNICLRAGRIRDISGRTRGYWQGDAGNQDRTGYSACGEELLEAAKNLEARSVTLMQMAGVYQEMENAVEELNASMRFDNILSK